MEPLSAEPLPCPGHVPGIECELAQQRTLKSETLLSHVTLSFQCHLPSSMLKKKKKVKDSPALFILSGQAQCYVVNGPGDFLPVLTLKEAYWGPLMSR